MSRGHGSVQRAILAAKYLPVATNTYDTEHLPGEER